jgi:hypothetical protein
MVLYTRGPARCDAYVYPASVLLIVTAVLVAVWLAGSLAYAAPTSRSSQTLVAPAYLSPQDQPAVAGARAVLNENP